MNRTPVGSITTTQTGLDNLRRLNTPGNFRFNDAQEIIDSDGKKSWVFDGYIILQSWGSFLIRARTYGGMLKYAGVLISGANNEDLIWTFESFENGKSVKAQLAKLIAE